MKNLLENEESRKVLVSKGKRRASTVGLEFVVFLLHIVGYIPSHYVRRFFYRLAGMRIGLGSTLQMGARFYNPSNIHIAEATSIGEVAVLDGRAELTIGDNVDLATNVMVYICQHERRLEASVSLAAN